MKNLRVCRASAGSGKTFRLAVEYIKLLVENPLAYRHVLAVTFTNKATLEMKQRILSQLYGLSHGLPDSNDYLQALKNADSSFTEKLIRERCGIALSHIIHNYHRFRIETIDSFFQSVVRELAHDLDLTANLRVELDNEEALKAGVERLIDDIVTDTQIKDRVFNYVNARMDDNKNWTISQNLQDFGQNIFNENYLQLGKELRRKLDDPQFIPSAKKQLKAIRQQALNELRTLAHPFLDTCEKRGYTAENFKQKGKGVFAFFEKCYMYEDGGDNPSVNSYVEPCLQSVDAWSKDSNVQRMVEEQGFIDLLNEIVTLLESTVKVVSSVDAIDRHLNDLSLVNTISKKVQEVTAERGDFLLANTNHFLHDMIGESDVPFIYERTGSTFDHIMIDEFQDTSVLQWENFKPLIHNSLDAGKVCLLVGDVKQSIYRWRNGDWSILNGIDQDGSDFKDNVIDDPLKVNYRSCAKVVRFNNGFFEKAAKELEQAYEKQTGAQSKDIDRAYDRCTQELPPWKPEEEGFVHIELLRQEEKQLTIDNSQLTIIQEDETLDDWYCNRLLANLRKLIAEGVSQTDICILVRKKKDIRTICQFMERQSTHEGEEPIRIISNEAFEISASPAVNLLVMALRVLQDPDDQLWHTMLTYHYQTDVLGNSTFADNLNQVFLLSNEEQDALLPKPFVDDHEQLAVVPVYELCERLYDLFELQRISGQDSYLFTFFDRLTEYLERYTGDIDHFIDYWDDTLSQKTISDGGGEGVRIMTIHKAKGLEFHTVIVPYCSWPLQKSGDLLWCEPKEEPFNMLPLSPVSVSKALTDTVFSDDYREEILRQFVDNLNLLYVAFTRARANLVIFADGKGSTVEKKAKHEADPKKNKKPYDGDRMTTMYDVIRLSMPEETTASTVDDDDRVDVCEFGANWMPTVDKKENKTENVLLQKPVQASIQFVSTPSKAEFRQSNNSKRFIGFSEDEKTERDETLASSYQNEGLLVHEALSRIKYAADLDFILTNLDAEGHFTDDSQRRRIRSMVEKVVTDPAHRHWFAPQWTVMNEHAILFMDEGSAVTRRPDRVITDGKETIVIDYKTGRYVEEHEDQVRHYMNLLCQMGMPAVKGFLWYIRSNEVKEINL